MADTFASFLDEILAEPNTESMSQKSQPVFQNKAPDNKFVTEFCYVVGSMDRESSQQL